MVKNEIREEVVQKCVERGLSGDSIAFGGTGRYDYGKITRDTAGRCRDLGNSLDTTENQTGFTPKKAHEMGLLGVDQLINWNNFKDIYDYHESEGTGWLITDSIYNDIKSKGLSVKKVSPLSVLSGVSTR